MVVIVRVRKNVVLNDAGKTGRSQTMKSLVAKISILVFVLRALGIFSLRLQYGK